MAARGEDLILVHPPSVFDFRGRRDTLFAYLSNSDSVAASPIFEIYPLGFKSLETYLERRGFRVRILNLAALMLRKPDLDVRALFRSLAPRLFGLDLHWMCHAHGAIEVARLLKSIHPSIPIVFGGLSTNIYWKEMFEHDCVDLALLGYDTHEPLHRLLVALRDGGTLDDVPNLVHRDADGGVLENPVSVVPRRYSADCDADWGPFLEARAETRPAMMVLPSAGCARDCGWCGGSRSAMRRIFKTRHSVVPKPVATIAAELASMENHAAARRGSLYTLNAYNFGRDALDAYLAGVARAKIGHVSYEQFHLTPFDVLERMVAASRTTIHLSPESHDLEVSRLAGRGVYSMDEMESWIERALEIGVFSVYVWFFIGMPKQTAGSVFETVAYCRQLLTRFPHRVVPLLCPMVPFLDPGSTFFEEGDAHGYKIQFRSLEEHRQALVHPSWIRRLNYETDWLSRESLATVSYDAVARLTAVKMDLGVLPRSVGGDVLARIEEARELVFEIDATWLAEGLDGVIGRHGDTILAYNNRILGGGVSDQLYPVPRSLENRWFDELEVS